MKLWRTPLDAEKVQHPEGTVRIIVERCKGCGFCVEYCPEGVLKLDHAYNKKGYHPPVVIEGKECVMCRLCELLCPDFSIFITEEGAGVPEVRDD